jgi:hypothetical protein
MSPAELQELTRKMREWYATLTPAQKVERLKVAGILDRHGKLSSSYGGDGEATRGQ